MTHLRKLLLDMLLFTHLAKICLVTYVEERPWRPIQSPSKGRKKHVKRLRGEEDQTKFIDLRFERWEVV